jgi:pimeloyl-ACP methyl ester carboxylesterase
VTGPRAGGAADAAAPGAEGFVEVEGLRLEVAWFGAGRSGVPIVMLHEGLGSVSMWKDFPGRLADATGRPVMAWSREGYGRSTPLRAKREPSFMHREALEILPALRRAMGLDDVVLFGHSDGGSIALIHAADAGMPVSGVVVLAPHVFVEAFCLESIRRAKQVWETTDLRARLGRYHDDPDSAFRGWNDIWLDPRFPAWNIEEVLPRIPCPVLAIQGEDDEYGTMEQIDRIGRQCAAARLLKLAACGHSPHRDQPEAVLDATAAFIARL